MICELFCRVDPRLVSDAELVWEDGEGREVNHHGKAITVGGTGGAEEQQENKLALQHKESDINISHKSLDGQATSDVLTGC